MIKTAFKITIFSFMVAVLASVGFGPHGTVFVGNLKSLASVSQSPAVVSSNQALQIAKDASPAIVDIHGRKAQQAEYSPLWGTVQRIQIITGTGFLVRRDGYIVTANHVIPDDPADYTVELPDGREVGIEQIYHDEENDIAVLKISGNDYPALPLGSSKDLQTGQQVMGIGNAFGQADIVSIGAVSHGSQSLLLNSDPSGQDSLPRHLFQSTMQLYPGESGGPTLDANGAVVGVNDAVVTDEPNISFSVPVDYVKAAVQEAVKASSYAE